MGGGICPGGKCLAGTCPGGGGVVVLSPFGFPNRNVLCW